jgi:hypothetical protein
MSCATTRKHGYHAHNFTHSFVYVESECQRLPCGKNLACHYTAGEQKRLTCKGLRRNSASFKVFRGKLTRPFSCILLRTAYIFVHTPGNVLSGVCHILVRTHRRCLRISCTHRELWNCRGSLTGHLHSKWLHIPCPAVYTLPSFLHLPPVCTNWRNDYK